MDAAQARRRFSTATVARMATVGAGGTPHLVPVVFALLGEGTVVTAVDHKRKRTPALARLRNIARNPAVALLADEYRDDWDALWWARADGLARVVGPDQEPALRELAIDALVARYTQYAQRRPSGDLIVVEVQRWSGWSAQTQVF
jgi:PPOX class probable F420-dependent enzyme